MITQLIIAQIPTGAVAQYNFSNNYDDAIGNADITSSAAGSYAQDRFTNVLSSLRVEGRQHNGYAFSGSQTELSVAFWMRIPAGDAGTQRIIQTFDQSGDGFRITFDGSLQILQVDFVHPNGNYVGSANVSGLNLKGSWHHMALVIKHTGSSFENSLYIDGVENGAISNAISVNNISPNFINSSAVFQISPASSEDYFGIIDDIVIFERGLTATEVSAIYNDPNPNVCTVNIPDANLKTALVGNVSINTNGDSEIQCSEASAWTFQLNLDGLSIADATGLETFVNATSLIINNNALTSIDLSTMTNLTALNIRDNNLSAIDVSSNTSLETLVIINNTISSIDLTNLTLLRDFLAQDNQLSSIDLSSNINLEGLNLRRNNLTSLDLSNNTALEQVFVSQNMLSSINLTGLNSLNFIRAFDNQLTTIDVSSNISLANFEVYNNLLTSLDFRTNTSLVNVDVSENALTSFTIQNGNNSAITQQMDVRNNPNLTCVEIDAGYSPTSVWLKDASASYSDDCAAANCAVSIPDANFKAALVANSAINTNGDTEIQCSEAAAFTGTVGAFGASISDATGVEAFVNTTVITFEQNSLTSIDLSANVNLEELYLDGNNLTTLDLTANILLRDIRVESNQLSSLILPNTNTLTLLRGSNNQLNSLDLSNNPGLESITLINNSLSAIDLSNQTLLENIYLNDNNLSSIDLSNNPELSIIYLERNDLGVVDISANPMATILSLTENELTSLDISNGANTVLNTFNASSNPDLTCIQIDAGFTPPTDNSWLKDASASYSDNCAAANCTVNIPDANFKGALVNNSMINTNGDTEIQCSEASSFTGEIDVNNQSISDLTGVEAFTAATSFNFFNNDVINADFSFANALITILGFSNDNLTSIDISGAANLESINVAQCDLNTIDVSNNVALRTLNLGQNNISNLNLTSNLLLENIILSDNNISALDVSAFPNVRLVSIENNNLETLNVANGNNINFSLFRASSNPDLICIQIDAGFTPPTDNSWLKDSTANYSDNCSNTADTTNPVAVCQDVTIQLDANGVATLDATQVDNGSSDDVGVAGIAIDVTSFDCSDVGTTAVTLTITDAAGNTDSCTAVVTIVDDESPVLSCVVEEIIEVNEDETFTLPDYVANGDTTATDNCSITITQSPAPGTQIPPGTTQLTFTATDSSGNTDTCSQDLIIEETLGLSDLEFRESVRVFPNPAQNYISIEAAIPIENIEIYTMLGQKLIQSNELRDINISQISTGIYFVKIISGSYTVTKQIIKK